MLRTEQGGGFSCSLLVQDSAVEQRALHVSSALTRKAGPMAVFSYHLVLTDASTHAALRPVRLLPPSPAIALPVTSVTPAHAELVALRMHASNLVLWHSDLPDKGTPCREGLDQ